MSNYALTIDGLPYYAVTPGALPVLVWTTSDDAPTGAIALAALEMPRVSWTERCKLVEGDLDVGGLTFELHDVTPDQGTVTGFPVLAPSLGIAGGYPWLSYLASRQPDEITSAVLGASFEAGDTTFTLTSGSVGAVSGLIPCVLWIDDEAVYCDSIAGQVVTVGARGYYGTRERDHLLDAETGVAPEAWIAPPWIQRRRVVLWRIDDDTRTAYALWRGYANRPRLSPNGASWQLQCEPAWAVDRARPLGLPTASTRVRGYDPRVVAFGALTGDTLNLFGTSTERDAAGVGVFTALDELLSWAKGQLHAQLVALDGVTSASVDLSRSHSRVTLRLQTADMTNAHLTAQISIARAITSGDTSTSNPQRSSVEADMPSAALRLPLEYDEALPPSFPVTTTSGIPAAFPGATTLTSGPHTTTVQTTLVGKPDEKTLLVFYPTASTDEDTALRGPSITAGFRYFDAKSGRVIDLREEQRGRTGGEYATILSAMRLNLGARIATTHWAYGLSALLADTAHINAGYDTRNFDTGSLDYVSYVTESETSGREWNLTGEQSLGDLVVPTLAAEGCCPAIRASGLVGFVAIRNPTRTETPVAAFTNSEFVAGTSASWEDSPTGIVNIAKLELGGDSVTVQDQRSIGRYGQGRIASMKLQGLEFAGDVTDARVVASRLLSRIVQVYGEPCAIVKWMTPLGATSGGASFIERAYCGDVVTLTDATTPNGTGGRGSTERRCQVIAKTPDLGRGTIAWEAIVLPVTYAYAPAIRVVSITGAVVRADYGYVLEGATEATDYAGKGGTDRGSSGFAADYCVRLRLRDTTTDTYYAAVVASVDPSDAFGGAVTLTASVPTSPVDWPTEAAAGNVDMVFDEYETPGIQATQKQYAYGGSGSASYGSIGSSGDRSRRWGA